MKFTAKLLYPFALLYGLITAIRNKCYDWYILKSKEFDVPIINVGNLNYGGTGKTPHVEYVVRLLLEFGHIAVLSRGYRRKTKGFVIATKHSSVKEIGDEPMQYKKKIPNQVVAVCEDRCEGAEHILQSFPDTMCILLDDAFQHRAIKRGMNILLTDFNNLYTRDYLIPSGKLRECRKGAMRADIIIVTKSPLNLSDEEKARIIKEINASKQQHIFFSHLQYGDWIAMNDVSESFDHTDVKTVLLLSGIANVKPFEQYFIDRKYDFIPLHFGDHYQFLGNDLVSIRKTFNNIAARNKVIVTTEKDAMRLQLPELKEILKDIPVYYLPVYVDFSAQDKEMFNKIMIEYGSDAGKNKRND